MAKRNSLTGRTKRERDRLRKRKKSEECKITSKSTVNETQKDSTKPDLKDTEFLSSSTDRHVYKHLDTQEERKLARVQASLYEKMDSKALRQSSPQGSRLFVDNADKALSPDSPAWVCTPARVPEHDDGFKPSSAGQAQLNLLGDKFSRNSNDECFMDSSKNDIKIVTSGKTDSYYNDRKDVNNVNSAINAESCTVQRLISLDGCPSCNQENKCICPISVQGSYHQGDPLFGDTAGSQCVANCLSGMAYHKIKSSKCWKKEDMDKILQTGNELYMFLQCSSTVNNRFLLVDELPHLFECFNESYEFHRKEPIPSIIYLSGDEPNYHDFAAYPLTDALKMALNDTDGCFICFGGNSLLVGKTDEGYFLFDSHSRCQKGLLSVDGKSTRVLYNSIKQIYFHLESLAVSLGFSRIVDCEITGVICTARSNMTEVDFIGLSETLMGNVTSISERQNDTLSGNKGTHAQNTDDSVLYVTSEYQKLRFHPLTIQETKEICNQLELPDQKTDNDLESNYDQELKAPSKVKEIDADGNCFFRAVSYCVTHSEDFHMQIRQMICEHMLQNQHLFQSYLRQGDSSVKSHLSSTQMIREGTWATEIEIVAVSHLLELDIYTYSDNRWVKYSAANTHQSLSKRKGSIYLEHKHGNHYNVVLATSNSASQRKEGVVTKVGQYNSEGNHRIHKQQHNLNHRMDHMFHIESRRRNDRKRYRENYARRNKKLNDASIRYQKDKAYREKCKIASKKRYVNNISYKEKTIARSKIMHKKRATNDELRKRASQSVVKKYRSDRTYRNKLKQRSLEKYRTNVHHRERMKTRSIVKYKNNEVFKNKLKEQSIKKYRTNESFRNIVKSTGKKNYHTKAEVKDAKKENVQKQRIKAKSDLPNEDKIEMLFKQNSSKGIDYICCCCSRLLFENQVQRCEHQMYEKSSIAASIAHDCIQEKYLHACSESCQRNCTKSSLWICYTCHRKILSGKMPAEAAANDMFLEDIPEELSHLNSLEQHLVALHIPFMKVMALPQGGQKNVHGPVVCVPSDMKKTTSLPITVDDNALLRVKLKRKLNYKGYFEYQFVKPKHIKEAIMFLKENNQWYKDIVFDSQWEESSKDLLQSDDIEGKCEEDSKNPDEDVETPMIAMDTCLQPVDIRQDVLDHYFDDIYNIAPGEGKNPIRMLQEEGNEAKTFPCLFPSGKFAWDESRKVKISLSRYFNNRLMNEDNRFAKDTNYIFFSQYMSELNQVIEKTQISMRKSFSKFKCGKQITSDMLGDPSVLSQLLRSDEALRFMQPIRGTPAYWSVAQKDLFAMLRQLGIPTWFCSFSAAEFRWNDTINTILTQQNDNRDPKQLDWSEKCEILRSNPVTVARMFEHRFHVFQRDVILSPSQPIGKVVDFFHRVEFQQRGSPHMHCLYWVENAPKFGENDEESICNFVDQYVSCAVPSINQPDLRKIVLDVQQHSKTHSKSCRKKGTECRFNFPRPPSQRTFINKPADEDNDQNCSSENSGPKISKTQAKEILLRVWNHLLDEANANKSASDIFNDLELTQDLYELAHNKVTAKTAMVLKRNPHEVWTNQYNPCLLKCWDANMDIQYVLDPFSCIVYIVSYISKAEREMGMLLKQTKIEAEEGNLNARDTMKKIGSAYLHHREVSAQEAVYRVCNLKMKECSRKIVFIPVGDNPTRLSKPLSQMKRKKYEGNAQKCDDDDDDDDEESIWMTNIIERYENRPDSDKFQGMCLAQFCSEFRVLSKSQVPKGPNESVYELQNGKGFIQQRTRTNPAVIRYPRFSSEKSSEKYYQSLLQLYLPHRKEEQLKPKGFDLYMSFYEKGHIRMSKKRKLQSVKSIVDANRACFAKNEDVVNSAQEVFDMVGEPEDAWAQLCPETEVSRKECMSTRKRPDLQENDHNDVLPDIDNVFPTENLSYVVQQSNSTKQEILPVLQSLNETQKKIFYHVRDWCLKRVAGEEIDPLHIFVTGGAGTGKSHLIKAVHFEAERLFSKNLPSPDCVSVVLTAFTGTAAFNIGGNTIHKVFALTKFLPLPYEPQNEQSLSTLRVKLESLQILVIDEVSMVYKRLLYYVHERLVQIKKCKKPFGGVTVLAVGDFFQLPPVKQSKNERLYKENGSYPDDHWLELFKLVELNEVMRQREDVPFAMFLNTLRIRTKEENLSEETKHMLKNCIRDGPEDALHVYSTNDEVNNFNLSMLKKTSEELVEIDALDYQKDKTTGKLSLRESPLSSTKLDGLSASILLSVNARVMLIRNINVDDGLVNGVMGNISHFLTEHKNGKSSIKAIGVQFDNKNVGKKTGKSAANGHIVLIERIEEEVKVNKSKSVVRHQFPLKLSWACTAHKVQGMTADQIVVNLDKSFSPGQAYVALSRVTSLRGLFIETADEALLEKKIHADADVKSSIEKMPLLFPVQNEGSSLLSCTKIILHNIQSLAGNFENLKHDCRFWNADILCLTETWLTQGQDTANFQIEDYNFCHISRAESYNSENCKTDRLRTSNGGGVAVYSRKSSNAVIIPICGKNIECIALKLIQEQVILVNIYRPSVLPAKDFLIALENVMKSVLLPNYRGIILGDFNENAKIGGPVQKFMFEKGFTQVVSFPTTEQQTVLDLVYTTCPLELETFKVPTYYSYHEAVLVNLKK